MKLNTTLNYGYCDSYVVEAYRALEAFANMLRPEYITPEHLLYVITYQDPFFCFCDECDVDIDEFRTEIRDYLATLDRISNDDIYEGNISYQMYHVERMLLEGFNLQDASGDENDDPDESDIDDSSSAEKDDNSFDRDIGIPDILACMIDLDNSKACYFLLKYFGDCPDEWLDLLDTAYSEYDISSDDILDSLKNLAPDFRNFLNMKIDQMLQDARNEADEENGYRHDASKHEPWEDHVVNLNATYADHDPLIGRKKELSRAVRILCRREKNNPLFIGEPGVGKTALIYGLVGRIESGDVPESLKGAQVYSLDMANLVAGASYHGEFEKRIKTILEGASRRGHCILYIDEIHSIMNTGGGHNSMNAAEILKPYLETGKISFIGTTTYQDYNKTIANNKAIARRFAQVDIKEPTVEETIEIINNILPSFEKHHGVKYSPDAIRYAVEQSDALIHDRFLPDKAIDIIDEAGSFLQENPLLDKNGNPKAKRYQKIGVEQIKTIITELCRIDAKALTGSNNDELKDLDKRIGQQIYGQDEAIRQVVRSVMMSKAGLGEPEKPLASLLFVGPTGVGKTEVCRVLAKELGVELVRFDMSEYTEKHTVSKLIGSPAGYVGYDEGGLLTDAIRKTPNCVLLLDEIEKAHSDIYNILLQVMDYAKLTDNKGNKADFRNVILIMTSNAGAQFAVQANIGFGSGQSKGQAMMSTIRKTFKPEFLNRLSGTVVFNDMDEKMAGLILDKKLSQLKERLKAKDITMTISKKAWQYLLKKGYTQQYGAREMDRAIQQHLTPLLMEEILFGKLKKGGKAEIDIDDDQLKLKTN